MGAALFMAAALQAPADPLIKPVAPEKHYTGMVIDVDTNEQIVVVKRWLFPGKHFAYSKDCAIYLLYAMMDNGVGTAGNFRPGEKVTVSYQSAHGVLVADRIEQRPLQWSGKVKAIDPGNHLLILHQGLANHRLTIATNCIVLLHQTKAGTLADIHPGDQVAVVYELPDHTPTAWQITR